MARPSKYNPALQKKFDDLVDRIGDIEIKDKGAKRKEQIGNLIEEFFTYGDINSIALYLGLVRDTIYDWSDVKSDRYKQEFSDTFKRWNTKRKAILFRITPFIDKTLAIFYNKTINGYFEMQGINPKSKVDVNVNNNTGELKKVDAKTL